MNRKLFFLIILSILTFPCFILIAFAVNNAPVVKNIRVQQIPGTRIVDITYDVEDADRVLLTISVHVSFDGGNTFETDIVKTCTGDIGENIQPGTGKHIAWDAGTDAPDIYTLDFVVKVIADDSIPPEVPEGMVLIPAGEFSMGDHHNAGGSNEKPVHTVYLDAYYIDKYEVTNAQYATFLNEYEKNDDAAGHELLEIGSSYCLIEKVGGTYQPKAGYENHPVIEVSWYGAAAYAQFYGKRLPTEAQWEKASRGGLVGKKYPNGDTISHDDANYSGTGGRDIWDRTSPVGSFPPNGYGLYDMAGNVWEWCADEYDSGYYSVSPKDNPLGPGTPIFFVNDGFANVTSWRVLRGGSLRNNTSFLTPRLRCADRYLTYRRYPAGTNYDVGFRCAQDF